MGNYPFKQFAVLFTNRTKPGTALIETALTRYRGIPVYESSQSAAKLFTIGIWCHEIPEKTLNTRD